MKRSWIALLALALAAPVFAQEEPAAEVVPADQPPAEETPAPAEAAPADAAPADSTSTEAAPAEAAPAEGSTETASAEPAAPWDLYIGADYVNTTLSVSVPSTAPTNEFDSRMLRVRVGKRVLESVGFELHYGVDQAKEEKGEIKTDSYFGAYLVPTATVFETVELAFPVGYGRVAFGDGSDPKGSVAYGIDAELPLKVFGDLPDIRLTAGGMVYYQKSDARVYGVNFGLRYDFQVDGFGNPFAGFGHWVGGLFGGGEDKPAE